MCAVPIEKDEGCAQMMCKRCKHVFCWYCLASLDVSIRFLLPTFLNFILNFKKHYIVFRTISFCGIMIEDHVKINWVTHGLRWYGIGLRLLVFLLGLVYCCQSPHHYCCQLLRVLCAASAESVVVQPNWRRMNQISRKLLLCIGRPNFVRGS